MAEAENKATIRRVFDELVNQGRYDVIDELYDPAMVDHDPVPGAPAGLPAIEHTIRELRTGFPDLTVTIEDLVAEGDRVSLRGTWRGTNTGRMLGQPPTGRAAVWRGFVIFRLTPAGKIVERWGLMDITSLLQQLGVIPPQGAGPLTMMRFMAGRVAAGVRQRSRPRRNSSA